MTTIRALGLTLVLVACGNLPTGVQPALAQEQLPWQRKEPPRATQPYERAPNPQQRSYEEEDEEPPPATQRQRQRTQPPPSNDRAQVPYYNNTTPIDPSNRRPPADQRRYPSEPRYGDPYEPAPTYEANRRPPPYPRQYEQTDERTFSPSEIRDAGHRFFGRVTTGLAKVIEYSFQKGGRPTAYIVGEEGGGAFVAGLRYGEGILHMKDGRTIKVFWQGPSLGYDFGAEGSKTLILVYNLWTPDEIFSTFAGVDGSAYVVGGVGITFQTNNEVTLAPIRSGVGLRLGANVGYLKYTRRPTWNPF